uniref:Uncharacterized protein n=1 Tax=Mycena chlorophos TaxID=658473 RepID=A0ABQ0L0Q0_MYCCL|nr:predicted protein [Mycena chlorophos]
MLSVLLVCAGNKGKKNVSRAKHEGTDAASAPAKFLGDRGTVAPQNALDLGRDTDALLSCDRRVSRADLPFYCPSLPSPGPTQTTTITSPPSGRPAEAAMGSKTRSKKKTKKLSVKRKKAIAQNLRKGDKENVPEPSPPPPPPIAKASPEKRDPPKKKKGAMPYAELKRKYDNKSRRCRRLESDVKLWKDKYKQAQAAADLHCKRAEVAERRDRHRTYRIRYGGADPATVRYGVRYGDIRRCLASAGEQPEGSVPSTVCRSLQVAKCVPELEAARLTIIDQFQQAQLVGLARREERLEMRKQVRRLEKKIARMERSAAAMYRAGKARLTQRAFRCKRGHSYSETMRQVAREMVTAGCARAEVGKLIRRISSALGVEINMTMSERTVGRAILEGLVAGKLQTGYEWLKAGSITISADSTMHRKQNMEARHSAHHVPDYNSGSLDIDPKSIPRIRVVCLEATHDHTADGSVQGWKDSAREIQELWERSPLARRLGLKFTIADFARTLKGMNGDHANNTRSWSFFTTS